MVKLGKVPDFVLRHPPFCGEDCERFVATRLGKPVDLIPRRGLAWQLFHPEFPKMMKAGLGEFGILTEIHRVSLADRLEFLRRNADKPIAIWVRTNPTATVAAHIVVIAGFEDGLYFVMDDRIPNVRAYSPVLAIGNAAWSEEYLLSVWRGASWRITASAVIPIL